MLSTVIELTDRMENEGEGVLEDPDYQAKWKEVRAIGKQQHLDIADEVELMGRVRRNEIMDTFIPSLSGIASKISRLHPGFALHPKPLMFMLRCAFWVGYVACREYEVRKN